MDAKNYTLSCVKNEDRGRWLGRLFLLKHPRLPHLSWKGITPINLSRLKELFWRFRSEFGAKYAVFETAAHRIQREILESAKSGSGGRLLKSFREYGSFSLVVLSTVLVSMTNITQEKGSGSPVFGYFRDPVAEASEQPRKQFASAQLAKTNLSLAPLATGTSAVDLSQKEETTEEASGTSFESGVLLSAQSDASITKDPEEDGGVSIYTVKQGDTVSGIAAKFNITVNTILWANDLDNVDSIHSGDQIFILPIAGLSHTVTSGETIDSIASKYKAKRDKIIAFNNLPANGELKVGDMIVIPGGYKEVPQSATSGITRRQYASSSGSGDILDISGGFKKLDGKAGTGHRFPYGYCTWYVAQKRYVPWSGNAGTWLYSARALGYRTGKSPAVGAIVVTTENRYYGHVALVEKVSGGTITVSEMNYRAWGKVDRRVLPISSHAIKGYIY